MVTEIPFSPHFVGDRDDIVTTDASRTGLGITLWQKRTDSTIRPIAFTSRFLSDIEKICLIGESELVEVVWGLEKFRFYLYGKVVYI